MAYTKDDPKWVQATSVESAGGPLRGLRSADHYVNVTAYGETFKSCLVQWSDPTMDKSKSDVLVQNSRGDWLRVWFYDEDVLP